MKKHSYLKKTHFSARHLKLKKLSFSTAPIYKCRKAGEKPAFTKLSRRAVILYRSFIVKFNTRLQKAVEKLRLYVF